MSLTKNSQLGNNLQFKRQNVITRGSHICHRCAILIVKMPDKKSNQGEKIDPKAFSRLIEQARKGDQRAFEEVYNAWYTPLYRFIRMRTNIATEDAEDLTQTVFMKFYESCIKASYVNESPRALLYQIARTSIIDEWRKHRHAPVANDEIVMRASDTEHDTSDLVREEEMKELVQTALVSLRDEQREIVTLRYLQELSSDEIAKIVGKSSEAVRQTLSRALKVMRAFIESHT